MPVYQYKCDCGNQFDRFMKASDWRSKFPCSCGSIADQIILTAPMSIISPDVCYDSPIDGRPITSMNARREDLARSGCVPYDPDIKQHNEERKKREDAALESAIDETVEREIETMPQKKREKLEAELEHGVDIDFIRQGA